MEKHKVDKLGKEEGATRLLYTVEESGVGSLGYGVLGSSEVEKRETCTTTSNT